MTDQDWVDLRELEMLISTAKEVGETAEEVLTQAEYEKYRHLNEKVQMDDEETLKGNANGFLQPV